MTEPVRPLKPTLPRRPSTTADMLWRSPSGVAFRFYLRVGYQSAELGKPVEIWLKATEAPGRSGTSLEAHADDCGESLSLLLQHGYTVKDLYERYKPGSLFHATAAHAWRVAAADGAEVPPPPLALRDVAATELGA